MNFLNITKELLKNRPPQLTLLDVANAADLSYSWVCKISGGSLDNPSYKKLQILHDYLQSLSKKK